MSPVTGIGNSLSAFLNGTESWLHSAQHHLKLKVAAELQLVYLSYPVSKGPDFGT